MADQDDEDYFSDNGLEDLPQSTIQDLEFRALSSTQQHVAALRYKQYNQATRPFKLSVPSNGYQRSAPPSASALPPDPASSDYGSDGLDDEDVIDLDEPSLLILPASGPPQIKITGQSNARAQQTHSNLGQVESAHNAHSNGMVYEDGAQFFEHQDALQPAQPQHDMTPLELRIAELEKERNSLHQLVQDAETAATKRAGEIAIIRAKSEKDTKEYERRIAVIQSLHAEDSAKHRAEVEAARKDRETIVTNNRFLEHDLAQEVERAKRFKPTTKELDGQDNEKGLTHRFKATAKEHTGVEPHKGPRNHQNGMGPSPEHLPYRDGFDDHEIVLVSPSKPKEKAKADTPKAGDKRKRSVNPSPLRPLILNTVASTTPPPDVEVTGQHLLDGETVGEPHFQTLQRIINHRPSTGCHRTLELLTKHAFPSAPEKSVAGLFIDRLTLYVPVTENTDLTLYVCNLLLDLWSRCLEEEYYAPMNALADLLEFVLALGPMSTSNALIQRFVPLAAKSVDLIAVPLARPPAIPPASGESDTKTKPLPDLSENINVDHILSIMHNMAMTASFSAETARKFWQEMEFDFTLMMLNVSQQLPHIKLFLQMVASSVLPESFGVIGKQPDKQANLETHTIHRLTNLLFEQPKAPSNEPPYTDAELASLRIETVRTLTAIVSTKHGSTAFVFHRTAIGRLVRFLHIRVTSLYDLPPSALPVSEQELAPGPSTIYKLTTAVINLTIRLLYHLLHHHADSININEKLGVIPGGWHKFIVCLTRIAFSEELVRDDGDGVEEEAVDAAHEILDQFLTPEAGDAVFEAIETPRASGATRASTAGC